MTASEYNASVALSGSAGWQQADLPEHFRNTAAAHGVNSQEFTDMVIEYQRYFDLDMDGKLGPGTWSYIEGYYAPQRKVRVDSSTQGEIWADNMVGVHQSRRVLKDRPVNDVEMIVVHTTGSGLLRHPDPLKRALEYYAGADVYTSHYLICPKGDLYGIVPENEKALHTGIGGTGRELYGMGAEAWTRHLWLISKGGSTPWSKHMVDRDGKHVTYDSEFPGYEWWLKRWEMFDSPLQISRDPNRHSIGIDLLPMKDGPHPGGFTDAQMIALDRFADDRRNHYGRTLPVLSHSDTHPLTRTLKYGPWDPKVVRTWDIFADAPELVLSATTVG